MPNGCLKTYEVKVKKDIFMYQAKVKQLISQFQRFTLFGFSQCPIRVCLIPIK